MDDRLRPGDQLVTTGGQLIVHIGLPKTGTSTIQAAIQALRPRLETANIWTPKHVVAHHRLAIATLHPDDARLTRPHYRRVLSGGHEGVIDEFQEALAQGRTILLSSEYFDAAGPRSLSEYLEGAAGGNVDVRVVVVLRRQDSFIESSFNQEVKRTGRTEPLTWKPDQAAPWDWYAKLDSWARHFGEDNISVLVYEELPRADFAAAALQAMQIPIETEYMHALREAVPPVLNASLPAGMVEFMLRANSVSAPNELDWFMNLVEQKEINSGPYCMPDSMATAILDHYQESNDKVARRFLGRESGLFDQKPL